MRLYCYMMVSDYVPGWGELDPKIATSRLPARFKSMLISLQQSAILGSNSTIRENTAVKTLHSVKIYRSFVVPGGGGGRGGTISNSYKK